MRPARGASDVRNRNVIISDCHLYHNTGMGVFYDNVISTSRTSSAATSATTRRRRGDTRRWRAEPAHRHLRHREQHDARGTADATSCSSTAPTAPPARSASPAAPSSTTLARLGQRALHRQRQSRAASGDDDTTQWGHLSISDNVLSDVEVNIDLQHVRGAVITGNTFGGGYEHDLLVEDSENIVVTGNNFDRNPRYASAAAKGPSVGPAAHSRTRPPTCTGPADSQKHTSAFSWAPHSGPTCRCLGRSCRNPRACAHTGGCRSCSTRAHRPASGCRRARKKFSSGWRVGVGRQVGSVLDARLRSSGPIHHGVSNPIPQSQILGLSFSFVVSCSNSKDLKKEPAMR
jgi:hypothetical protein